MPLRRTVANCAVVRELLDDFYTEFYGYSLMKKTGYTAGTLYPVLDRLVEVGWLSREKPPKARDRVARRYYSWKNGAAFNQAREWLAREPVRSKAARDVLAARPLPPLDPPK